MNYILYLFLFLLAGFIFGLIITTKRSNDYKAKTAMLKARLEWMKTEDYKEYQKAMDNLLYYPKINTPISFANTHWTKHTKSI